VRPQAPVPDLVIYCRPRSTRCSPA
jgi:hypothetical protein